MRFNKAWFWVPALLCAAACGMMMVRGDRLYWGPADSDLSNQFYPWHVFIHRWFARGVWPAWDPHVFSGYPTLETQQMLALNPVHLLSLCMPANWGLIFFMAIHTLVAGGGMAWGLWKWGRCSAMAAALGAGLYVFSGLFAVRVMAGHFTVVAALAWWPLAALSVLRIVRLVSPPGSTMGLVQQGLTLLGQLRAQARLRRLVAVSGVAHAMVLLAGGPQYVVYLFYMDLAIMLAVYRRGRLMSSLLAVAFPWILAVGISAPQWLPALWYLPYSIRALIPAGSTGLNLDSLLNLWLEAISPFPFGNDLTRSHLHFKNVWETATYPGTVALILAMAALLRTGWWVIAKARGATRAPAISPLTLAGALALLAGFYMIIGAWLPGFSGFREPAKARAIAAFAVSMLGAAAFDGFLRRGAGWRACTAVAVAVSGAMLAAALRWSAPGRFLTLVESFGVPMDHAAHTAYMAVKANPAPAASAYTVAMLSAAAVLVVCGVAMALLRKRDNLLLPALMVIALADPFMTHSPSWLARHPWANLGLPAPVLDYLKPKLASPKLDFPWRVALNSSIINRTHLVDGLYETYGYDPLMPAFGVGRLLIPRIQGVMAESTTDTRAARLDRVGIRYDLSHCEQQDVPFENDLETTCILTVDNANLFAVTQQVVAGSPGNNLFGPDMQGTHYVMPAGRGTRLGAAPHIPSKFRKMILTDFAPLGIPDVTTSDSPTSQPVSARREQGATPLPLTRPDEWRIRIRQDRPALAVLKTTWLPGWTVSIEGEKETPALIANNWMCAAIVPAGDHVVTFRYRPVAWWPSLTIAAASSLITLVLLLRRRPLRGGPGVSSSIPAPAPHHNPPAS